MEQKVYQNVFPSVLSESELFTHLVGSGDSFLHSHSYFEIVYIVSGTVKHFCNGTTQRLTVGDMFILRPADIHRFIRPAACFHRDVVISSELFRFACDYLDDKLFDEFNSAREVPQTKLAVSDVLHLENVLNRINFVVPNNKQLAVQTRSCMATILGHFLYTKQESEKSGAPLWLKELLERFSCMDIVQKGIPGLLENIPYNQIYICRVFKKYLGMTMTQYLNLVRLHNAALYLKTRNLPIETISEELGFSSPTQFYKLFRARYGCTPAEYKNKT